MYHFDGSGFRNAVLGCLLCLCSIAEAAEQEPVDEVTITGQRSWRALEQQIYEAEDKMYGLFNELNTDDRYDIHCHWEPPAGTRILQRQCRPTFYDAAIEENAKAFLANIQAPNGNGTAPTASGSQLAHHYPILEKKLRDVMKERPEFFDAVQHYTALQQEMDKRRGRPVAGEE